MVGALIGNIAAWTYEHDKALFYKQLIPEDGAGVTPSVYGHALMKAASHNLITCPWIKTDFMGSPEEHLSMSGQWLMWHIIAAWQDDCYNPKGLPNCHWIDKEEGYARMFVTELIRALRHGASKSEAYHANDMFVHLSKDWHWKKPINSQAGLLTYVFRAWNAFYLGFDFTSTIHNAVKWDGDRHLTTILAATFADAMYGCEQSYIKHKYAAHGDISHDLGILTFGERFEYHHALMHEMMNASRYKRSFFPKNSAMTNVERHLWKPAGVELHHAFCTGEAERILMAGYTGWENRFGLYLDDGWVYCYRSHWLLLRFRLIKAHNEQYHIRQIQLSGEKDVSLSLDGLCDALYATCHIKTPGGIEHYFTKTKP